MKNENRKRIIITVTMLLLLVISGILIFSQPKQTVDDVSTNTTNEKITEDLVNKKESHDKKYIPKSVTNKNSVGTDKEEKSEDKEDTKTTPTPKPSNTTANNSKNTSTQSSNTQSQNYNQNTQGNSTQQNNNTQQQSSNAAPKQVSTHTHNWVPQYKTVHHPAEYQTIYHDAVYESVSKIAMPACGLVFNTQEEKFAYAVASEEDPTLCYGNTTVITEYIEVQPAWTEQKLVRAAWDEQVITGYTCSCGDRR